MSQRLEKEIEAKAKEIYDCCGSEFNINSPKQLGDVLFNKLNLPKPVKYGKGKTISTAVDVLEGLAADHDAPRLVWSQPPGRRMKLGARDREGPWPGELDNQDGTGKASLVSSGINVANGNALAEQMHAPDLVGDVAILAGRIGQRDKNRTCRRNREADR